jgi:formylglycine-generating enzyme required for sulfatase activity
LLKWLISCDFDSDGYRLPTEAEWEYAAREGGRQVRFGSGKDTADPQKINFNGSSTNQKSYSKAGVNRKKAVRVGSLPRNQLGLGEMSGNVWEWCWDWYGRYDLSSNDNPKGCVSAESRVLRGGSWIDLPSLVRAAHRGANKPFARYNDVGFRLARTR